MELDDDEGISNTLGLSARKSTSKKERDNLMSMILNQSNNDTSIRPQKKKWSKEATKKERSGEDHNKKLIKMRFMIGEENLDKMKHQKD